MEIIDKRRLYEFKELKSGDVFSYGKGIYMKFFHGCNKYGCDIWEGILLSGNNYVGQTHRFKNTDKVELLHNIKLVIED